MRQVNSSVGKGEMETTYFLTGKIFRRLKRLGYLMKCYHCGKSVNLGDKGVTYNTRRFREIFHEPCWEQFLERTKGSRQITRTLLLAPPAYQPSPVPHIILKKGIYSTNPGEVLCPRLQEGFECSKHHHGGHNEFKPKRPRLLVNHHVVQGLQLWECLGCESFLLRVEKPHI